jgi:hypothetical protein
MITPTLFSFIIAMNFSGLAMICAKRFSRPLRLSLILLTFTMVVIVLSRIIPLLLRLA